MSTSSTSSLVPRYAAHRVRLGDFVACLPLVSWQVEVGFTLRPFVEEAERTVFLSAGASSPRLPPLHRRWGYPRNPFRDASSYDCLCRGLGTSLFGTAFAPATLVVLSYHYSIS